MFSDPLRERTTSNRKLSDGKIESKKIKVCDKRSIEFSSLDQRSAAKAKGHYTSKTIDISAGKPQESSMKRKLEELHSSFFCAQESNVKNTVIGTHLQGSTENSCCNSVFEINSTHLSQPKSLNNTLKNKNREILLPSSVIPNFSADNASSKKLSSCVKKSSKERLLSKQINIGIKPLDKEECMQISKKIEYFKNSIPSSQSIPVCSKTTSYKKENLIAHSCLVESPNCKTNYHCKKMKKTTSSDFAEQQTSFQSFQKENLAPNSFTQEMSAKNSSKTCTIISAKPQDFHHRIKTQFNQLHSSFFPSQDLCPTNSMQTSFLFSSSNNSCASTVKDSLIAQLGDNPGSLTDSKFIELTRIKTPAAQTSTSAEIAQNLVSSELLNVDTIIHDDLPKTKKSNLEKNILAISSHILTQKKNGVLGQEQSSEKQRCGSSTKLGKKSNSEPSLSRYVFSAVKKSKTYQASPKSGSFESDSKTLLDDQEKYSFLKSKKNVDQNSFCTPEPSIDMQHSNHCSEPSSLSKGSLENLQCGNSNGECLEKETYELSEDQCEIFFSSVLEWKKFMSSPISCGFKSRDLSGSEDRNCQCSELALANEKSNLVSKRNCLSKPEKFKNLHQNRNSDCKLGFKKNVDPEPRKSEDSLYPNVKSTEKMPVSTSGSNHSLQQRKTRFNNEVKSESKPLNISCEIPFLTVKKPQPENQTNVTNSVQLLIMDLLNVTPTSRKGYYMFHDLVIHYVDVFGIIIGVRTISDDKIIYEVDDGSGTISCMHQITKLEAELKKFKEFLNLSGNNETFSQTDVTIMNESSAEQNSEQDAAFKEFKACMENHLTRCNENLFYKTGDTIHATGVLYDFRGTISFYIYDIRKVTNVAEETDRHQEMIILYHSIYPKIVKGFKI